ncbi:MAG: PrsW family intramembrane metalloprotease [Saprospirales bacterium]|nr:PrsW family intramembrane metalloprotease [Saprospirales bacterium]MBK8489610.1 PrsW family intramembrane metalloprotease [Saprospirales bacterium]
MYILILLLAVLPGLLISYYIIRQDKYDREPRLHLLFSFVAGMLITFPVLIVEKAAANAGWDQPNHIIATIAFAFVAVALVEEGAKLLVLLVYPYSLRIFNEPMDGIVYSVMIGMGFATLENVLYAGSFGLQTILVRALTAVPAHGAFSIILGYFVGLAKFQPEKRLGLIVKGFLLVTLLHGAYDFFILQSLYSWLIILAVVVLAVSIYYARRMLIDHQEHSPFK